MSTIRVYLNSRPLKNKNMEYVMKATQKVIKEVEQINTIPLSSSYFKGIQSTPLVETETMNFSPKEKRKSVSSQAVPTTRKTL